MSDREAFIAAIIANKGDDTPRLVFADWLVDTCDPPEPERAEFIRVQCELAQLEKVEGRPTDPMWLLGWKIGIHREMLVLDTVIGKEHGEGCEFCRRIRERELLTARHEIEWRNPLVDLLPEKARSLFFRGFVTFLECTWADWLAHHAAILAAHPIERVKLTTRPDLTVTFWSAILGTRWPGVTFELPESVQWRNIATFAAPEWMPIDSAQSVARPGSRR